MGIVKAQLITDGSRNSAQVAEITHKASSGRSKTVKFRVSAQIHRDKFDG